jgi:hypothetical protein
MLSILGLFLIIIAWLIQIRQSDNKISIFFIGSYLLGTIALSVGSFIQSLNTIAWLNLITFLLALIVLIKNSKK